MNGSCFAAHADEGPGKVIACTCRRPKPGRRGAWIFAADGGGTENTETVRPHVVVG